MSDTEDLEISVTEPSTKPEKKKKVMTPVMLEKLKLAREKAAQVKKAAREEKEKVQQELIVKEKAKRLAKMEEKVKKSFIDLDSSSPPLPDETHQEPQPKEPQPKESQSLPEKAEPPTVKSKKSKKKVLVMHDSGSDSDSDTQVIYIPRRRSDKPKEAPPEQSQPPAPVPAFGYMPRYQLHNFNQGRQFH
jgi:hypothetical protein